MILAFIHICKRMGIDVIGILNRLGNKPTTRCPGGALIISTRAAIMTALLNFKDICLQYFNAFSL